MRFLLESSSPWYECFVRFREVRSFVEPSLLCSLLSFSPGIQLDTCFILSAESITQRSYEEQTCVHPTE